MKNSRHALAESDGFFDMPGVFSGARAETETVCQSILNPGRSKEGPGFLFHLPRYSTARSGGKLFGEFVTDNNGPASYPPAWTKPYKSPAQYRADQSAALRPTADESSPLERAAGFIFSTKEPWRVSITCLGRYLDSSWVRRQAHNRLRSVEEGAATFLPDDPKGSGAVVHIPSTVSKGRGSYAPVMGSKQWPGRFKKYSPGVTPNSPFRGDPCKFCFCGGLGGYAEVGRL